MDPSLYRRMSEVEDTHWWFAGRRAVVSAVLDGLSLPRNPAILEAGCGTGGNLAMLSGKGRLHAFEMEPSARESANRRGVVNVEAGSLPDAIPFGDTPFDLIVLLDVLEHVEKDGKALEALRKRLKRGGYLVATVPAFSWLWSAHDEAHHHFRRYVAAELRAKAEAAGLEVAFTSYFCFLLFPAIAAARLGGRLLKTAIPLLGTAEKEALAMPSPPVNALLAKVFGAEAGMLARRRRLPYGSSLLMIARKP